MDYASFFYIKTSLKLQETGKIYSLGWKNDRLFCSKYRKYPVRAVFGIKEAMAELGSMPWQHCNCEVRFW